MMWRIVLIALFVSGLAVTESYSQKKEGNQTIVYDPLFWKDKLKLKDWQRLRINEINADFYGALIEYSKAPTKSAATENVHKLLTHRSEQIWNTFSERQKNIWKRLESQYSASI